MVRCHFLGFLIATFAPAVAPGQPVIHYINDSQVSVVNALTAPGDTFVTDYRGTNDVTITLLATNTARLHNLAYTIPPATTNNPNYVTGFVGSAANGTGDGTVGTMSGLLTQTGGGSSIQVDFANRIGPSDRLLFTDIDTTEVVSIQAFTRNGSTYTAVPLSGWTAQAFTGETGMLPDSTWASWNPTGGGPTTGTFTSTSGLDLAGPLNVLTPDLPIDRITFSQNVSSGAVNFQVIGVPEPTTGALGLLAGSGLGLLGRKKRGRRRTAA
jgi:hypothetical protein